MCHKSDRERGFCRDGPLREAAAEPRWGPDWCSVAAEQKRSFWLHQLAEYLIGAALVVSGLQSPTPTVPTLAGGLILLNAACADGPLGAFRLAGRRLHRVLDWIVVAVVLATVAWPGVEVGTRLVQLAIGCVYAVVVWRTDYTVRSGVAPAPGAPGGGASPAGRGEEIGRAAGRATARGVRAVRKRLG